MNTEQNLKVKLTFGSVLLIALFSAAIFYILKEVKKFNVSKNDLLTENTNVIEVGNIVSELYAAENSGRLALLSYNKETAKIYHNQLDSLVVRINTLKEKNTDNKSLNTKLDTIINIVNLKSVTFDQVLEIQSKYASFNIFNEAESKIKTIYNQQPNQTIKIDTTVEKTTFFNRFLESFKNKDDEKKAQLENQNAKIIEQQEAYEKEKQEKINSATEIIFSKAKKNELKLLKKYYDKEAFLIKKNQELSNQLRDLLSEVEKIVIETSNIKHETSRKQINTISNNIAKLGIAIAIIAFIFGLIILNDLNKSARNKRKLESLNLEMERLIKQKSFFMATISHDMVSPINSLMGFSTLLKNSLKTSKQNEYLQNIIHSTEYIKKMVDDLSLFSNLEYNKIKLKNQKFNANDLLKNIYNNLKTSAENKKIDLIFRINPQLNNFFYADSFRMQQILTNVLSNAIKFTHSGSVTLNATYENNIAKFIITDTGIGIKTENKDSLFTEFVQVHNNTDYNYGGSGLGLNISKRLINLLQGSISFNSEINKGTTFYIDIPLQLFTNDTNDTKNDTFTYDNNKKLQNKQILVIDDDPIQLKLIEEILIGKVKKLTTLENGKLVTTLLQNEQYHLIITDMQMPLYSGIQVIKDIRALENYKDTPVIALTGKIDFDDEEYKKLGFDFYLQKPLNINTLYNIIYKMLRIKVDNKTTEETKVTKNLIHKDFNLTDLFVMLENDTQAIKQILNIFYTSVEADIEVIKNAYTANNLELVKQTAHKMLPMFKQLKMERITIKLIDLEKKTSELTTNEIKNNIDFIAKETPIILKQIEDFVTKIN
ncbi:ATP-binding protein [Myroides sp. JBRI-B21084]|uniref:ATP-binding protein n=1 Tax=Myroides sp. JBRI-B21084 TaxID=3119977 RepID=UPI0026E27135|nr:ATP-binding protein [Paenimyroides cloacae]WKW47497.1 ATP-binding protein [Paenimyroides cloacae]